MVKENPILVPAFSFGLGGFYRSLCPCSSGSRLRPDCLPGSVTAAYDPLHLFQNEFVILVSGSIILIVF
jgi:hypothetical protein